MSWWALVSAMAKGQIVVLWAGPGLDHDHGAEERLWASQPWLWVSYSALGWLRADQAVLWAGYG